ncbi:Crp/Fnr family transcriptional regulator [Actibacterium pelagium]|uniref:Crp/Fnr family transcriptional regulator n=1 Tax=Actibacterium pelagium TaxID=2029103 RepID=A0A917AE48_9RHOB|nr:Crp/Fnr family transcriptional regulator [Actibacterium pelagium]GGE45165.1 Crp/Fnr family transcriptional regulator [Actibacterium pelagium]
MNWTEQSPSLASLDTEAKEVLNGLPVSSVPSDTVLFRPGDAVTGYVIPLEGRINVCLTSASGRDLLLYEVTPGQSCIQTTLGLIGNENYSAEAYAETDVKLVLVPKAVFLDLLGQSEGFRNLVFATFASRMQTMMQLLEKVAFLRVEARLAQALLARSGDRNEVTATQSELATIVGSAREVVARKLAAFARDGLVELGRGRITVLDRDGLGQRAEVSEL